MGLAALVPSDGLAAQATDDEILRAQRDLAEEGILAEPASAAALAGIRVLARRGELPPGRRLVLINTSAGIKNLGPILSANHVPDEIPPSLAAFEHHVAG
jgi:threonine synthase